MATRKAQVAHGGSSISTITDFVNQIIKIRSDWSTKDPYQDVWFRGVSKNTYELKPGAYRKPIRDEYSLASTYRALAPMLLPQIPTNDWDWYYHMQHYGIPTRLLDWTESPLQALHFALSNSKDKFQPAVWVLNPVALNFTCHGKEMIFAPKAFESITRYDSWLPPIGKTSHKSEYTLNIDNPIAIYPIRSNPRLHNQRGTFTVHGKKKTPLENINIRDKKGKTGLIRIDIAIEAREELLRHLWLLGITTSTTYPEPEKLAEDVKRMYNLP